MALNNNASEYPSADRARNLPMLYSKPDDHPTICPDNSFNYLSINFCSILGSCFNLYSVEHHLFSKLHLFLSESQVSEVTDSNLYSVPF